MRLVNAAKASPHAKFYNLGTGYSTRIFQKKKIVLKVFNFLLKFFFSRAFC